MAGAEEDRVEEESPGDGGHRPVVRVVVEGHDVAAARRLIDDQRLARGQLQRLGPAEAAGQEFMAGERRRVVAVVAEEQARASDPAKNRRDAPMTSPSLVLSASVGDPGSWATIGTDKPGRRGEMPRLTAFCGLRRMTGLEAASKGRGTG